jgi:TatD DNase family protein
MFTDTHTHLYDERLLADNQSIPRALAAGVTRLYIPNCDTATIEPMWQVCDKWPEHCFPMIGLHPTYVKEDYRAELDRMTNELRTRNYVAVGEIGLDYYWDVTHKTQQHDAFAYQIDLALQYALPIVIHSRESNDDCIDVVRGKQTGELRGIFHCFSGDLAQARAVTEMGLYLGIGGVVTYKKSILPDIVREIPLEYLVLETDAPYLAPVPHRGKRNESAYIPLIAATIAEIKGITIEEVAAVTTKNAEKVFEVRK